MAAAAAAAAAAIVEPRDSYLGLLASEADCLSRMENINTQSRPSLQSRRVLFVCLRKSTRGVKLISLMGLLGHMIM